LYGDKAYLRSDAKQVMEDQNLVVLTPVKKQKGQNLNADEKQRSTAISRVHQPIESLFSWIEQQTGIECASKVRSYNGLLVHVFGKFVAAFYYWNFVRAF
ncbi:MAG: IS982 family transposase, partial [Methylococcales bacterium]|nr:IS982 family transposase [Methylococcales bacterium]